MKIGILTQPLSQNYGGILQAFALQAILKKMGFETWIVNRDYGRISWWRKVASVGKGFIIRYILGNRQRKVFVFRPTEKQKRRVGKHITLFINEEIYPLTPSLKTKRTFFREIKKHNFMAYVVGSDQVWRPCFSPCITNYFLDFVSKEKNIKRIAYAASFGVDDWEFTEGQTRECREFVKLFDAVSVREDSGICLCQKYLNVDAKLVLDPTLLLEKEDYISLVHKWQEKPYRENLMTYILDRNAEKTDIVCRVASGLGMSPFSLMPAKLLNKENQHDIENCVFPSVTSWLRGFMDAEFVITDSFHGCVFSIIFNKPFLVIGNHERGMARFNSLLKLFGLEDRLIHSIGELDENKMKADIDWDKINSIKAEWRMYSLNFLKMNLSVDV